MFPETLLYNTSRLQAIAKDDPSFVPHMLKVFVRAIAPTVEEIRKVCRKKQWGLVRALAMGMQPAIVYLEIHSIKDTVLRISELAETESPSPELEGLIDCLCKDIVPVKRQMEQELRVPPGLSYRQILRNLVVQLSGIKWFGHIVVHPGQFDPVDDLRFHGGGQRNDGDPAEPIPR